MLEIKKLKSTSENDIKKLKKIQLSNQTIPIINLTTTGSSGLETVPD